MLNKLSKYIEDNDLFDKNDRLLVAVSGGKDSVALVHMLFSLKLTFSIAHCNFNLRDFESKQDEMFVSFLAKKYDVPFFLKRFASNNFESMKKKSIQMIARELRYKWFYELLTENNYTKILTAHHLDDSIETYLIKKRRNSSIEALRGILPKNNSVVRPLMCFFSDEILAYINRNNIIYREDSSNSSLKYLRNEIRLKSIPEKELANENYRLEILKEIEFNKIKFERLTKKVNDVRINYFSDFEFGKRLGLKWIDNTDNYKDVLYMLLREYGPFNWKDVFELLRAKNGKFIENKKNRIIRERDCFEISVLKQEKQVTYSVNEHDNILKPLDLIFTHCEVNDVIFKKNTLSLDLDKLEFPLKLRKWNRGDKFIPLGMRGSKLISDFLIDKKCSTLQKENTWVLFSKQKIAAIIGYQISDEFKLDKNSKFAFKITTKLD
ncbi:MAG: tRNA lysidine(34) synthetase TilS [Flavobacteriales bacterium]